VTARKRSLLPALGAFAACLMVAGCASSSSVLYSGVSLNGTGKGTVITDAAAVRDAKGIRSHWLGETGRRSSQRFPGLPEAEFRRRLAAASARYHFTVETAQFRHAGQATPLVVLRTDRYVALARAIPAIEQSLDPHKKAREDWLGWTFRGFYLEAQDERGVPFVVVNNVIGLRSAAGGQWARSDPLFPFIHA
jgi:hypothetical protein